MREVENPITILGSPPPRTPTPIKTTPTTVPAREWTYDYNGEPDIAMPPYPANMKGSRIGKITTLKTGGGLARRRWGSLPSDSRFRLSSSTVSSRSCLLNMSGRSSERRTWRRGRLERMYPGFAAFNSIVFTAYVYPSIFTAA